MATQSKQRQTLSLDLDSLFPGEPVTIGNTTIHIKPLSIEQIAVLSRKITGLGKKLTDSGVTWDNYNEPKNIFQIGVIILENFPDVLEEAANVAIDDLKILPLELIVEIVDKIMSVNLKSKDALEKNFKSLTANFAPVKEKKETPKAPAKKIQKKTEK